MFTWSQKPLQIQNYNNYILPHISSDGLLSFSIGYYTSTASQNPVSLSKKFPQRLNYLAYLKEKKKQNKSAL